jgi:hypothetical protein
LAYLILGYSLDTGNLKKGEFIISGMPNYYSLEDGGHYGKVNKSTSKFENNTCVSFSHAFVFVIKTVKSLLKAPPRCAKF